MPEARAPRRRFLRPRQVADIKPAEKALTAATPRHNRGAEKSRRPPVARRPEVAPPAMPTTEVDLGGVLRRHDPPSSAGQRRSFPDGLENLLWRHTRRPQKTMGRHLASPIAANLVQNQRAGGHHPLKQSCSSLLPTHVAKKTDAESIVTTHRRLPLIAPAAV